jgi:hypothetical protein
MKLFLAFVLVGVLCGNATEVSTPMKVSSFSAVMEQQRLMLHWQVAENEIGEHFELERSNDGINFKMAALIFTTDNPGTEHYWFRESKKESASAFSYRLKIIQKNGSSCYAGVIAIR